MQENNKKRIRLTENSDFVWSQRNKLERRADKNAHSNTVQNDNILYRNAKAAKQAEDKLYAEKMNAAEQGRESKREQVRSERSRQIREGLGVRDAMLRQEHKLGMDGALSRDELMKAQYSPEMVGKAKPMNVSKRDVRGLEGKRKRRRRSRMSLLPSERKNRFNRKKLERNRDKERARIAEKETGKKLTAKRLRELRGLSKKQIKRRDLAQVRRDREQSAKRTNMARTIRKRDEYTR